MAHTLLSALPPAKRKEVAGIGREPPVAKGASHAYYFDGEGEAPLPNGTPISVWSFYEYQPGRFHGYWIARTSSNETWAMPCVFRTRKGNPVPRSVDPDKDLRRGAMALERGAKALEGLTAQLARATDALEQLDTRVSYLAAQIELSRRDDRP